MATSKLKNRSCNTSPKYNPAVNKKELFYHADTHLVSSNVLTGQILSVGNLFMSKALMKIKHLQSIPILICDICCPRVGNDRKQCLFDESLFIYFFLLFILRVKLATEVPQNRWLSVIGQEMD